MLRDRLRWGAVNPVVVKLFLGRKPTTWCLRAGTGPVCGCHSTEATAISRLDDKIYHEQIRLIYNQGPVLVFGATLCAILMTAFLWTNLPQSMMLVWLGAVCLSGILRFWVIRAYQNANAEAKKRPHWGPFFWAGTLSAGMIWGAWPLMFYDSYSTEFLLLISTIFAGMVAVSAASGCIYLPSFASFSTPLVIPLAVLHFMSGNDSLMLTGFFLFMFLGIYC